MRDKAQQMWCIACNRRVMTQEDLAAELENTRKMTAAAYEKAATERRQQQQDEEAARKATLEAEARQRRGRGQQEQQEQQEQRQEQEQEHRRLEKAQPEPEQPQPAAHSKPRPAQSAQPTARELMDSIEPTEEERALGSFSLGVRTPTPRTLLRMKRPSDRCGLGAAAAAAEQSDRASPGAGK